jgi:3-phosphoshikimate 1-carboxyvinyltransferase
MIQVIERCSSIRGSVSLPGDKSISHRYAMLAAIAEGTSRLTHFAASQDCRSTLNCLRQLGVEITQAGDAVTVQGRGLRGMRAPSAALDAGNSGTTIRLLSGILAGQEFQSTIGGDASLSRRPMGRILDPLQHMGASIEATGGGLPPLKIRGGKLKAIRYSLPVASAQVKSCVLLAGLYADGVTGVEEAVPTRDHTEVALAHFGATIRSDGRWIEVDPSPTLVGRDLHVPGDLSGAAFFLTAAAMLPGAELLLPCVGLNARRRSLLDYLVAAGLDVSVEGESTIAGEPRGDVRIRHRPLSQIKMPPIRGEWVAALIDEIPVLVVLGSQTPGGIAVSDARELRVKESDRIAALALNLRRMGAQVEEKEDGLQVAGSQSLKGAEIDTKGDHRIAMAFAVAGLVAGGATRIEQAECADVSFPGFWDALSSVVQR